MLVNKFSDTLLSDTIDTEFAQRFAPTAEGYFDLFIITMYSNNY